MAESDPQFDREQDSADRAAPPPTRRWPRLLLMVSVPLLLVAGVVTWYALNDHYVSTDNAYLQQDKISVSAELGGRIVAVGVKENQRVKPGDLLFRIDPEPYTIALAQADAAIASAQVKVVGLETELATTASDIATARANLEYQQQNYDREAALFKQGFSTRARMDTAQHALAEARGRLAEAAAEEQKARAALVTAPIAPGINPAVLTAMAQRRQASYNLTRTEVRAPVGGTISQADRLLNGQMMMPGLPAVSIVVSDRSWVEANFKETDLGRIQVGQPAEIEIDAYPGLTLKGHVESIGAGTGSEFSVLPAQNANGNWVKVTQRVPVRIAIDTKAGVPLRAGLSTNVRIDISR